MNSSRNSLFVLLVMTACASVAYAQTTFTGANGTNWFDPGNWDIGVPGPMSAAIIPSGLTAVVDQSAPFARAATLTVQSGATVQIAPTADSDARLHLGTSICCDLTSVFDGEVRLLQPPSGAHKAILSTFSTGYTFEGAVGVIGEDDAAELEIGGGLTNKTKISGHLKIIQGTLINWGTIDANAEGGKLLIEAFEFDDCDCPVSYPGIECDCGTVDSTDYEYRVENGGTLEFSAGIGTLSALEGDFLMTMPAEETLEVLLINEPLTSTGRLNMETGKVTVNENVTLGSTNRRLRLQVGTIDVAANKQFYHN